ncbi:hypothetical protein AU468_13615 [Alkalispirochaeta sphaeroplastigenens]|uniref:Polymerase beta nucleotidyltransferase domain-containing protein n=1 Tax=Alkalispirochaeta sphaeroplastigenens TaxID=1187066 RepID=A0A2S4JFP3_9SPIO|nr:nucleotidyltransferase domain-containing protein [Alkalispirochaeta sphaeroplastigenens]POQ98387.1 hypothetical protein AU468_13615 [Alkalispirochaeta sphaeroplastigenens]
MTSHDGLSPAMRQAIITVVSRDPRVEQVVLFGSRAKGTHHEGSDIDLAVYGTNLTRAHAATWQETLEDELFPWGVDIVIMGPDIDEQLRAHIERVGTPVIVDP